jgi:hypothetical protein
MIADLSSPTSAPALGLPSEDLLTGLAKPHPGFIASIPPELLWLIECFPHALLSMKDQTPQSSTRPRPRRLLLQGLAPGECPLAVRVASR